MKLHPLLRSTLLLLLLIASAPSQSQTFTFDLSDWDSGANYRATVNTSSKRIEVTQGTQSLFTATYVQAQAQDRGVAFSFKQGQNPSLRSDKHNWFFAVKPNAIGFNNPDTEFFTTAYPADESSYSTSYNSLVAVINGTASNNVSNNNVSSSGSTRTYTANGVSFTMVYVPGGTFTMGATSEQESDAWILEKPTHQVTLSSFCIGQTEVTQELWQAVMGTNPSKFKGSKLPVECVSWDDCQDFIRKLNNQTGQNFRLPTEAEWEYAARGGKSGGTKYAGSYNLDDVAWYAGNSGSQTHDVATKRANSLGIYDMSGNVWEWCQDWYSAYSSSSQTNPQGPSTGSDRVLRGGGWPGSDFDTNLWRPSTGSQRVRRGGRWSFSANTCRVSYRRCNGPGSRFSSLGLRLAL